MANQLARMRQLIGPPADWSANDLVIGDGEFALLRDAGSAVSLRVGDGTKKFSQLPALWEFVSIKAYGADGRGLVDDTQALVNAIAAAKAGPGVVLLPRGKYRISAGAVDVSGVALVGAGIPEFGNAYDDNSSVILLDSLTTTPFTLGLGWRIEGLTFFYPAQDGTAATPIAYPPLFTGTYVAGGALNNCTVVNAYQIFKFPIGIAIGDLRLHQCRMYAIDRVFWFLQGAPEVINISDCFFSYGAFVPAYSPNVFLRDYTTLNGEFCRIDVGGSGHKSVDGFDLANTIVFGYRFGFRILSGLLNVSTINNCWFDQVSTALSIEATGAIANTRITDNYFWSDRIGFTNSKAPVITLSSSGAGSANLLISGNDFVYSRGHHIYWNSLSISDLHITDNRFMNWGLDGGSAPTTYYAIGITDAVVNGTIGINKFRPSTGSVAHSRDAIVMGGAADIFIFGNEFDDCFLPIWLNGGLAKATVISNVSRNTGFSAAFRNDTAPGIVYAATNQWDKAPTGPAGYTSFSAVGGTQTFTGVKAQVLFASAERMDRDNNLLNSIFTAPFTDDYAFDAQIGDAGGTTLGDVWLLTIEGGGATVGAAICVTATGALGSSLKCSAQLPLTAGATVAVYLTRFSGTGNYVTANNGTYNVFSGRRVPS